MMLTLLTVAALACGSCYGSITEGQKTPIINHPFQVSISVDDQFVCSGSLIHPNWVLTVASCVQGYDPYYMKVRTGSARTDSDGTRTGVRGIHSHEKFSDTSMDYDIALLELEQPVKQGPKVRTIRLADKPVSVSQPVTVSGWGVNQANDASRSELMRVEMKVNDLESCKETMTDEVITPRMICASNQQKNGPCWGDFGDPMVNQWRALVGSFSFTKDCTKYPSVFTNAVVFKSWIKEHLNREGHDIE